MTNKNYRNGAQREYYLMKHLRKEFPIVLRTAGSHGAIDIIAIDTKKLRINFIQSKPPKMSKNAKRKIEESLKLLNNEYICKVFCVSTPTELKKHINSHPSKSAALIKDNKNMNDWAPSKNDNSGNLICIKCGNSMKELNDNDFCQKCLYSELQDDIQLNQMEVIK